MNGCIMNSLYKSGSWFKTKGKAKQLWSRMRKSRSGYASGVMQEWWGKLLTGFGRRKFWYLNTCSSW